MSAAETRTLPWPPEPGEDPGALAKALTGALGPGGTVLLIEAPPGDPTPLLEFAAAICGHWEAEGISPIVVDAHPAAPFTAALHEGSPEGFTELLRYGLGPERLLLAAEGRPGRWLPPGAGWTLPLELESEPARGLRRLAELSTRILVLADADDAEGLLGALRANSDRILRLAVRGDEGAAAVAPGTAVGAEPGPASGPERAPEPEPESGPGPEPAPVPEPLGAAAVGIESGAEFARAAAPPPADAPAAAARGEGGGDPLPRAGGGYPRRRWLLIFPAALIVFTVAMWLGQRQREGGGEAADVQVASRFTPLPDPAELPYHGGGIPSDSGAAGDGSEAPPPRTEAVTGETDAPGSEAASGETDAPGADAAVASARETPVPRGATPSRRFEGRAAWRSLLDHSGVFHVHVESYRDSILGARSASRRGFQEFGFTLSRAGAGDDPWYRLRIGPFATLAQAAAFRDSLLDRTDEDYCVIDATP